jgi:kynurenine 3-monooxygenase
MADALPMRGRMIHPVQGELDFQPYSPAGDRAINSISRRALNNALLDAAEALPGVRIEFDHRLVALDSEAGEMTFDTADGAVRASAEVILGADGAGSAVRGQLRAYGRLTESLDFLDYGYKELTIPPRGGDFALAPDALHIWPRGTSMMIALPNPDRSFTCTLIWPTSGAGSFAALGDPAAIERHFATHYPDLLGLAPDLVDDYLHNPVGPLGTVRCTPWHADARVGLLGDAAHAIVPFYGQGANCAFEDVVELDRCLDETADTWEMALPLFEARRRENAEAIAQMALANFVEMRDKVTSPVYRLGKKIEHVLERTLPGRYVSRYELVSFSTTPYAQVQRQIRRRQQLVGVSGTALLLGALGAGIVTFRRARGRGPHRRPGG